MKTTDRRTPPSRPLAATVLLVGTLAGVAGTLTYLMGAPDLDQAAVALAGDPERAAALLEGSRDGDLTRSVTWDLALILGYATALAGGCWLGSRVFWTEGARRTAVRAGWVSAAAVGADLVENVLLWRWDVGGSARLLDAAAVAAGLTWALLLLAVPVALTGGAVTTARLLGSLRQTPDVATSDLIAPPVSVDAPADTPTGRVGPADQHWRDGAAVPPGRDPAEIGICVSGGGIRSGCVTLGALQELRRRGILSRASYLVSVSGGGFVAAAFRMALQPPLVPETAQGTPGEPVPAGATPADVFAPGSVEEDHLRRHSSYLSDGAREWAVALLVVLRGLLSSLGLVALAVVSVGIGLGAFYEAVPFVDLGALRAPDPDRPGIPAGTSVLLLVLLGGAGAAYGLWLFLLGFRGHDRRTVAVGQGLVALAGLVLLLGVGLPVLLWAASTLIEDPTPAQATGGAVGPVLLAYAGTLAGLLWKGKARVGGRVKALRGEGGLLRRVPVGVSQRLLVLAALVVLVCALALLLGTVAVNSPTWSWWWRLALPAALVFAYFTLDQTWLSLHPFYRRRLASAFAVRRGTRGGRPSAVTYDFAERTTLSEYASVVPGFPRLLLAAAANLSGQSRTPPGRRAVSFTFGADWVGGPHVGYVRTAALQEAVPEQLKRDLTLQAAVSVSGAAFASAMGRQARAYETFLALSNARLGTWLPNPSFLLTRAYNSQDWTLPRLPRLRRLTYQLREILGLYPQDDRLLLCTDGGHVENLGLVELLRHGVRTVYVVDASGDKPPFATTLAEAVSLAREELGVEIALDDPLALVPGSAEPLLPSDPLADLNGRLSASTVVTGTITYPHDVLFPDGAGRTGRIIISKAGLTTDMPYSLLAYAVAHPTFPRDNTSDQWFDIGQFDAYTAMGRHLAAAAVPVPTAIDLSDVATERTAPATVT